jgi:predicted anti-sigma-YlaC factor YlaD
MDCRTFEEQISEYLDGALAKQEAAPFRAHLLQCRACRALLDDVKCAVSEFKTDDGIEPSPMLESSLCTIASAHAPFDCAAFEALITEFLDGFVPAATYHRFEEHAADCDPCSGLLTEVVYAVAACHSVHTYEEVEAPESLFADLLNIASANRQSASRRLADRVTTLVVRLIPRPRRGLRWSLATAASLVLATFGYLLFGFSDDGTVKGIYRQAHVKFGQLYSQGADIYAQKDELAARLERVGIGIGEIWDSLGSKPDAAKSKSESNPHANGEAQRGEKN